MIPWYDYCKIRSINDNLYQKNIFIYSAQIVVGSLLSNTNLQHIIESTQERNLMVVPTAVKNFDIYHQETTINVKESRALILLNMSSLPQEIPILLLKFQMQLYNGLSQIDLQISNVSWRQKKSPQPSWKGVDLVLKRIDIFKTQSYFWTMI